MPREPGAPRGTRPSEYTEAASSLQKAHDAVTQRDYRQALNYAIDSRAARAGSAAAGPRGQDAGARHGRERLRPHRHSRQRTAIAPARARSRARPAKDLQAARSVLAAARQALQEASTAITAGNFEAVSKSLTEVARKARRGRGGNREDSATCGPQEEVGRIFRCAVSLERRPLEDELGPSGQEQAFLRPLDALGAARRDDLHVARRAAVS